MKKLLFSIVSILGFCLLFPSCEKDVASITSLDGDYVLQKAEVDVVLLPGKKTEEEVNLEFVFENGTPALLVDGKSFEESLPPSLAEYIEEKKEEIERIKKEQYESCSEEYLFHEYEYIFDKDGSVSVKDDYYDNKLETGRYKVSNGWLYFPAYGFDIATDKIVSNKGNSLVLEINPELLELLTIGKDYEITRSVGYYKKK